jgi:hypothetical protein
MNISTYKFNEKEILCFRLDFLCSDEKPWLAFWGNYSTYDPIGEGVSRKDALMDLLEKTNEAQL